MYVKSKSPVTNHCSHACLISMFNVYSWNIYKIVQNKYLFALFDEQ